MSADADDDIEVLRIETLSADRYPLRRYRFSQRRGDGTRATLERQLYELGESVAVLPIDRSRGTVLLVRQLRLAAYLAGDPPALIEACAGHLETGDSPADAARREAAEELGYELRGLQPLFTLYMSPGLITERIHFFVAEYDAAMARGAGGGLEAEGEDIAIIETTIADAWRMVERGEIIDAKTVLLLQHARLTLPADVEQTS
ncbi:MAG TPA: NUDIX domain-containing protein [Stellaceae bacterium]|nr:NUDIX domain-containing protein [Stellaceae bacterium]